MQIIPRIGIPFIKNLHIDIGIQSLICETQEEGAWPIGHPLPLPTWRNLSQQPYYTFTIWQYEELASNIELFVQRLLEDRNYDTVGNFLKLYNLYKTHGSNNLSEFFHRYRPIISTEHHTCVGLALELWYRLQQLNQRFPNLSNHFYLVSCEEAIDTVPEYAGMGDNIQLLADTLEKEHVLLALKINVMGRVGVLLCDPGYHVARVITVMRDKTYPHTGWFTQSSEDSLKKEYNYIFSTTNTKYVEWMERETRGGIQKHQVSLIYTSRPYLTAIDVTERRNLVYDFRSLLSRDTKGHLLAGFYFKVSPGNKEFTVFYQENGRKRRVKMDFDMFLHKNKVSEENKNILKTCNDQLRLDDNQLDDKLSEIAELMSDSSYLTQLLNINNSINSMTDLIN